MVDAAGSAIDSLFALAVLAFILIAASTSIRAFVRAERSTSSAHGSLVLGPGIRGWYITNLQPLEERCV
ncbi:MAG TPA: hypothetical protein VMT89_16685, partial [Candidatus Acidoferrales bacterium]|nr:hypothetical protein [Candidatus Acidoferrales bacterium]